MANKEQNGFDSGRGSSSNPIWLPEVIVYGRRPLPWYKRALNGVAKFFNDEIFLNKNNIRVKNARAHPKAMNAVQEGGNIAGAIAVAPLAAYTAVQAAPVIMPALKVAGLAMTPSTWIGGLSQAAGYLAPAWMLNGADLSLSAHFANEAGKDIDKNGLTWRTGLNALMSLAPFTRETEAINGVANTVKKPMSAVNSVVDDFRAARNAVSKPETALAREFNRSVKNTKLINVPVEHVSPNGVTKGASLDVGEEGIHLSPAGSPTTATIQSATGFPFVRTGTWTYSNNTRPVEVQDVGYFGRGFNPDFDAKVDRGATNFKYTNRFEGNGNTSYLTMEPSQGLLLSKNTSSPIYKKLVLTADLYGVKDLNGFYIQLRFDGPFLNEDLEWIAHNFNSGALKKDNIGTYRHFKLGDLEKFKLRYNGGETFTLELRMYNPNSKTEEWYEVLNGPIGEIRGYMEWVRENTMKKLSPIRRELINHYDVAKEYKDEDNLDNYPSFPKVAEEVKKILLDDIDDFYMSPEYMDRLRSQIRKNSDIYDSNVDIEKLIMPNLKNELFYELSDLKDTTTPVVYGAHNRSNGVSQIADGKPYIGINVNHHKLDFPLFTITHENGHNMWGMAEYVDSERFPVFLTITELNKRNFGDPRLYVLPEVLKVADKLQIEYMTDVNEFTLRIREGVKDGILKGYSPELIYDKSPVFKQTDLKSWYPKEYLIKALSTGLALTPLITNSNGKN